jgi:hypothetical protein
MNWVYDDGGRKAAGFRGKAGDWVAAELRIAFPIGTSVRC